MQLLMYACEAGYQCNSRPADLQASDNGFGLGHCLQQFVRIVRVMD